MTDAQEFRKLISWFTPNQLRELGLHAFETATDARRVTTTLWVTSVVRGSESTIRLIDIPKFEAYAVTIYYPTGYSVTHTAIPYRELARILISRFSSVGSDQSVSKDAIIRALRRVTTPLHEPLWSKVLDEQADAVLEELQAVPDSDDTKLCQSAVALPDEADEFGACTLALGHEGECAEVFDFR